MLEFSQLASVALLFASGLYGLHYIRRLIAKERKKSIHGCQPPPRYTHRLRSGMDLYHDLAEATKKGDQLGFALQRYARYGRTYSSTYFGREKIHTCDPRNLRAIFATQNECFSATIIRRRANKGWFKHGIMIEEGEDWAYSRRILSAIFRKGHATTVSQTDPHVKALLANIPTDGSTIDLQPLLLLLFLDLSTEWLFGRGTEALSANAGKSFDAEKFIKKFDEVQRLKQERTHLGLLSWLRGADTHYVKAYTEINEIVDSFVYSVTSRADLSPPCFVKELMAHNRNTHWLRDQVINVFQPARDGTALGLAGIFSNLARHPNVWEKMRKECLALNEPIDAEKLLSLEYMRLVVRESLRLLSPVGRALRTVVKDTILPTGGGSHGRCPVLVAAGSEVECDWTVTQRDREFWGSDAADFRPERWRSIRPKWEYIPFMAGPRICPAQHMVLLQYLTVLWRMAREFKRIDCRDPVREFLRNTACLRKVATEC